MSDNKENSLLWKITAEETEFTSYLFGTIHMICEDDFYVPSKVRDALLTCQQYVTEIDFGDTAQMQQMQESGYIKKPLSERMLPEQHEALTVALQKHNLEIDAFEHSSYIGIISQLSVKCMPCTNITSYDMELYKIAMFNGLETGGLETVTGQIDIADNAITTDYLLEVLKGDTYTNLMTDMLQAYEEENLEKLYEVLTHKHVMDEQMKTHMLKNRNNLWADYIASMVSLKPVFYAFGAAHLLGDEGIIALLRNKGFDLKPIF